MTNPERILATLDAHLNHEVALTVYGRAAIALGFNDPPDEVQQTLDVDAFMIRHDRITPEQIEAALSEAVIPDVVELQEAFDKAKPLVRELARTSAR